MGGIERASVNIANIIASFGHDVIYIALFRQNHFFDLEKSINFIEPSGFNKKSLNLVRSLFWVRKTVMRQKPDAVLVFNYFYGAIACLALIHTHNRVFVSNRASPIYNWPKHIALFNYSVYSLTAPTGMIAQTKLAAKHNKIFFGDRTQIKIIPNALRKVQLFPEVERKKQILAIGRLNDKLKGFDRLIDAFARIKNQEWILVFAGGDEEGIELKSQAKSYGVLDRIVFLGKVKDIDRVYAEAGIFVIPSRSEGFPNALCEAMAAGLPCISFDFIAGPKDIITNGYDGILVENNNIELLAEAIELLIEDESERLRLGENAMKIRERLDEMKIGQLYLNFILGGESQSGVN